MNESVIRDTSAILEEGIANDKDLQKTYHAYLKVLFEREAEGETNEARRILLLLGRDQFGEPSASVQTALNRLTDVTQFEALILRLKHVTSWKELMDMPGPRRRAPRRK